MAKGENEGRMRGRGLTSAISGMRRNDRRKLREYATKAVSAVNPKANSAARATPAAKASFPLTQTDRATPMDEMGGSFAIVCALATDIWRSRSGTAKTLASKPRRKIAITNRASSETRRNAEGGRTAIKRPASANIAKKLKILAKRTAIAWPAAKRTKIGKEL